MNSMPVYLATSDKTMKILPATAYCINKFWPGQEVNILGFSNPTFNLPENFFYHSLGVMTPVNEWSNPIREFMKTHAPNYFVFGLDDMLPIKPIDTDLIGWLTDTYCDHNLGRIGLTNDIRKRKCEKRVFDKFTAVIATQDVPYRVSTQYSIWSKDYFLECMRPGLSPWTFEKPGSINDNKIVVGTNGDYAVHLAHGIPSPNVPQHNTWKQCSCSCNYKVDPVTLVELQELIP